MKINRQEPRRNTPREEPSTPARDRPGRAPSRPGAQGSRGKERQQPAAGDVPQFGFNESWGRWDTTPAQLAELAAQSGAKVARLNVLWDQVEPQPGQYDQAQLQRLDEVVAALREKGIKPLLVPLSAPEWARPNNAGPGCRPPDPEFDDEFGGFVGMLAQKYSGASGIEVWNEPNLDHYGKIPPERYGELLTAATAAIKGANKDMTVVSAGLSPTKAKKGTATEPGQLGWEQYLRRMMTTAKGDFDVGLHPYAYKGDASELGKKVERQYDLARKLTGRDIWITEMGFSSGLMSQQKQAKALHDTFERLADERHLEATIVHRLMDDPNYVPDSKWEQGLGTIDSAGNEKKVYRMLRRIFA